MNLTTPESFNPIIPVKCPSSAVCIHLHHYLPLGNCSLGFLYFWPALVRTGNSKTKLFVRHSLKSCIPLKCVVLYCILYNINSNVASVDSRNNISTMDTEAALIKWWDLGEYNSSSVKKIWKCTLHYIILPWEELPSFDCFPIKLKLDDYLLCRALDLLSHA